MLHSLEVSEILSESGSCINNLYLLGQSIASDTQCINNHEYIWHKQKATTTRNPKVIWEELRRRPSRRESHWLECDTPHLSTKLPLPFDDYHLHLIHPSFDRPHSPLQTASRSNKPFFHNSPIGPTDRPMG